METRTTYVNLEALDHLCKGDREKHVKYLRQFNEVLTPQMNQLQKALESKDFISIRQILHHTGPQLTFFGRPRFAELLIEMKEVADGENWINHIRGIQEEMVNIKYAILEVQDLLDQSANTVGE